MSAKGQPQSGLPLSTSGSHFTFPYRMREMVSHPVDANSSCFEISLPNTFLRTFVRPEVELIFNTLCMERRGTSSSRVVNFVSDDMTAW